jgi:hypothetical protein
MADKVTFQTNIPVEVALKYSEPKEVTSQFRDQPDYLFTLVDGRIMFLPRAASDKVLNLGVAPGEPIQVARVERVEGRRKIQDWEVKRVFAPGQFTGSAEMGATIPAPVQAIPASNSQNASTHYPHSNGNGRAPISAATLSSSREEAMAEAMQVAVRVLNQTKAYALKHGIEFKITERDVISLGCTVFINGSKERY